MIKSKLYKDDDLSFYLAKKRFYTYIQITEKRWRKLSGHTV